MPVKSVVVNIMALKDIGPIMFGGTVHAFLERSINCRRYYIIIYGYMKK